MKLNYCVECAASLEKKSDTEYVCANGHPYWNNPRATVSVILAKDKNILFSKRGREPDKGKYDLPGGFLEFSEEPFGAAKREIAEETGIQLDTRQLELIAVYGGPYSETEWLTEIILFAKKWHGTPVAADDVAELAWKPLDFLYSAESAVASYYTGLAELLRSKL